MDSLALAIGDFEEHTKVNMPGNNEFTAICNPSNKERIFSGSLTLFGQSRCPKCEEGYLEVVNNLQSSKVVCTNRSCYFCMTLPEFDREKYPNIVNMFLVVNNTTINIRKVGEGVVHDFSQDTHEIVEDGVLNRKLLNALSGTHEKLADLLYAVYGETVAYENKVWYVFRDHKWRKSQRESVGTLIRSGEFKGLLMKAEEKYRFIQDDSKTRKLKQYL